MPEPEGTLPYRFRRGKWEELGADDTTWTEVDPDLAAILQPYTKVGLNADGDYLFSSQDGSQTITGETIAVLLGGEPPAAPPLPGAPVDAALFQAGFPLGVAQRGAGITGQTTPLWWNQPIEAVFGVYPPLDKDGQIDDVKVSRARAYAEQLGISGASAPVTPKATAPLIFKSKPEALAEVAANGGQVVRRSDGNWGVVDAPTAPAAPAAQAPTFEEEFTRLLLSGETDKAQRLWDAREAITSGGGRMTRFQAAQLLLGDDLFKAEEIPALLEALMGGPQPGAGKSFEEALASAAPTEGEQPTTPTPTGAVNPFLQGSQPQLGTQFAGRQPGLTPEEFDPLFAGASPEAQTAIRAELDQRQGGPSPFTAAISPTATTPSDSFTSRIQADLKGVTDMQHSQIQFATQPGQGRLPDSVEEWDPNYIYADPEAQAAIKAEFDRLKAAEDNPFTAAITPTAPTDAGISAALGGQRIIGNTTVNLVPSQGRLSGSKNATLLPDTTLRGIFAGGLPDVEAARQRLNAAGGGGGGGSTFPPPPPSPKPRTFEEVIALRNERVRHRQMLRPQGRTLFA